MSQQPNSELSRREVLKTGAAAGLALTTGAAGSSQSLTAAPAEDNPVRRENANPGTREWMLTKTDITMNEPVELWRSPRIEGYCSATSVSAGESLKIMVSTNPASEFDLEVFRTGYYVTVHENRCWRVV